MNEQPKAATTDCDNCSRPMTADLAQQYCSKRCRDNGRKAEQKRRTWSSDPHVMNTAAGLDRFLQGRRDRAAAKRRRELWEATQ